MASSPSLRRAKMMMMMMMTMMMVPPLSMQNPISSLAIDVAQKSVYGVGRLGVAIRHFFVLLLCLLLLYISVLIVVVLGKKK